VVLVTAKEQAKEALPVINFLTAVLPYFQSFHSLIPSFNF
jgi:hypothetical protein